MSTLTEQLEGSLRLVEKRKQNTALAEQPAQALAAPSVTPDQMALITRTIAKEATPDELKLYLYDCQRQGVHPLDKLIHFTKRSGKYTPITSIDFMRIRAAETNDYAGSDDPVFVGTPQSADFAATVTVWRFVQGQRCPFTATARWSEYKPEQNDFMWRKMPHTMLGKCVEALALRKGFPRQLAGLYAKEELDQADGAAAAIIHDAPATVVDANTGEDVPVSQAPDPPAGYHYLSGYTITGDWHEAYLLKWDAQGGSLKIATKYQHVAKMMAKAANEGIPVKADVTVKRTTKGEAYVNKLELWKPTPLNAQLDAEIVSREPGDEAF